MKKKRDNSDLTGRQFTRLFAINKVASKSKRATYTCRCSCGAVVTVLAQSLKAGVTKSCGCLQKEVASKELCGLVFGDWKVLYATSKRSSKGYRYWQCKCKCGTEKEVCGENLLAGKSKSCNTGSCCWATRQFCLNGHDTKLWGRTVSQTCRACIKDKSLRANYGISLEEFIKIYEYQQGKCCVCKKDLGAYLPKQPGWDKACRIEVDHDHKIKDKRQSVRGLLCGGRWAGCNRKLGRIDNIRWLKGAVDYLFELPAQKVINGL